MCLLSGNFNRVRASFTRALLTMKRCVSTDSRGWVCAATVEGTSTIRDNLVISSPWVSWASVTMPPDIFEKLSEGRRKGSLDYACHRLFMISRRNISFSPVRMDLASRRSFFFYQIWNLRRTIVSDNNKSTIGFFMYGVRFEEASQFRRRDTRIISNVKLLNFLWNSFSKLDGKFWIFKYIFSSTACWYGGRMKNHVTIKLYFRLE